MALVRLLARARSIRSQPLAILAAAGVLVAARPAAAYNPLSMGSGPVLSPEIVPVFWGTWPDGSSGDPDDQPHMLAYLKQLAGFVAGVGAPPGQEPVLRQYGVWDARFRTGASTPAGSTVDVNNTTVVEKLHLLQSQGLLPSNSPNRIFVMFISSSQFRYNFSDDPGVGSNDPTTCAYHDSNNGTYYAVIPLERARSLGCGIQSAVSHELMEAMTDPVVGNGWVTHEGPFGLKHKEGGDQCGDGNRSTLTALLDFPPIGAGTSFVVQNFADNSTQTCAAFAPRATASKIAIARSGPNTLDVVWPVPPSVIAGGGAIGHAWFNGSSWQSETVPSGQPNFFIGTPSVVSTANGRLDVYVRTVTGQLGHFGRATPTSSWSFSVPTVNGTSIAPNASAQPSASTSFTNRTDIVVRNWDASVGHYWSNDNTNFFFETFSTQTIGPPRIMALGNGSLDVFTYSMNSALMLDSFANATGWSGFRVIGGGPLIPVPPAVVYHGTLTQTGPFQEAAFASFNHGTTGGTQSYELMDTATVNGGTWNQSFNRMSLSSFGAVAAVANSGGNAPGVELAYWENSTKQYVYQHFGTNDHNWNGVVGSLAWDQPQPLGGVFINPPAISLNGDGRTYMLGVATDNCLYYVSVLPRVPGSQVGPSFTGVCNVL